MIAGCAQPGDVFVSKPHEFPNGTTAPSKFIVILGVRAGVVLYMVCTSQEKHGRTLNTLGCQQNTHNHSFLLLPPPKKRGKFRAKQRQGFNLPTWVVLDPVTAVEEQMRIRYTCGELTRVFSLSESELAGIWKCFRGSWDHAPVHDEFGPK